MKITVNLNCEFCGEDCSVEIDAPEGWNMYSFDVEPSAVACPAHSGAIEFLTDQCPGCVAGWGECEMSEVMERGELSDERRDTILSGRCPYRVNGTMMIGPEGMQRVNLSDISKHGAAFLEAHDAYCKEYRG